MSWEDILKKPYTMKNPNFPKRQSKYFGGNVPDFDEKVVEVLYQGSQGVGSSEYVTTNIYEAMPYALFGSQGKEEDPHFRLSGKPIINITKKIKDNKNVYYDFNDSTAMTGREHNLQGGSSEEDEIEYEVMDDNLFNRHYRIFKNKVLTHNPMTTAQAYVFLENNILNDIDAALKAVKYAATKDQVIRAIKGVRRLERTPIRGDIGGNVDMFIGNAIGMPITDYRFLGLMMIQLRLLEMKYNIG